MEREQDLRELAFRLDLSGDEAEAMLSGMRSIVRMPVESVLQMLCTINYVFNHERLELKDLRIYEQEQTALISRQVRQQAQNRLDPPQLEHNTYDLEQRLLRMVRKGDTAALRQWLDRAPAVRSGVVAGEPLRQRKNLFIVTVTLVSRAAIQGGMQVEDAFTLSDSYIQQCELTASPERIANLQYRWSAGRNGWSGCTEALFRPDSQRMWQITFSTISPTQSKPSRLPVRCMSAARTCPKNSEKVPEKR